MPEFDPALIPGPLLLVVSMFGAFISTAAFVLIVTTPQESPAMRLHRYARYSNRPGSPGVEAETSSIGERLVVPLLRRLIELAARAAPSRARQTVAADLAMAGSRMNPTMFLGIRTLVMFGLPTVGVLYVLSSGALDTTAALVLAVTLIWGRRVSTVFVDSPSPHP